MIALPLFSPPRVTLDVRGTSLARAIPQIGSAFGMPMRATAAIGDEIGVFSLRGAGLEEFQARVAATFAAEWSTASDGTLVLNRSARLRGQEERAFFAARERGAASLVAALRKEVLGATVLTPEVVAMMRRAYQALEEGKRPEVPEDFRPMMPERRLLAETVALVPLAEIARRSGRVVYSSSPTPMQRAFPRSLAPLVAQFERERKVFKELESGELGTGRDFWEEIPVGEEPGATATVQLAISTTPELASVELAVYDARGRVVSGESEEVGFFNDEGPVLPESRGGDPAIGLGSEPHAPKADAHVFPVSEESRAFGSALGSGSIWATPQELLVDRNLAKPFLNVVERDPLSYALSDVAFEAGRITGRSVILRPGDEQILVGTVVLEGRAVPLEDALATSAIEVSVPGWLTARTISPYRSSLAFFPRPALREALLAAFADGRLSLPTAIRIASLTPDTGIDPPLIALPSRLGLGRTFLYLPVLRLLAAMGDGALQRAANGIRVGDLPLAARERLERLVFGPERLPLRAAEPRSGFANPMVAETLDSEPTSALPRGLPLEARMTVTTSAADGVAPVDPGAWTGRPVTVESLALYAYQLKNPKLFAPVQLETAIRWRGMAIRRSGRTSTVARVDLTPRHAISFTYQSLDAPGGPEFTMATLPPDLQVAFDQAMAGVELRFKDAAPYDAPPEGDGPAR